MLVGSASLVLIRTVALFVVVAGAIGLCAWAGGDIADEELEGPASVVMVRADRTLADGDILVGKDGSPGAQRALEWVSRRCRSARRRSQSGCLRR